MVTLEEELWKRHHAQRNAVQTVAEQSRLVSHNLHSRGGARPGRTPLDRPGTSPVRSVTPTNSGRGGVNLAKKAARIGQRRSSLPELQFRRGREDAIEVNDVENQQRKQRQALAFPVRQSNEREGMGAFRKALRSKIPSTMSPRGAMSQRNGPLTPLREMRNLSNTAQSQFRPKAQGFMRKRRMTTLPSFQTLTENSAASRPSTTAVPLRNAFA